MRLRVAVGAGRTETAYFYPDVFVHCGPPPPAQSTEIEHPKLVVEVLSPGTEEFDRTEKFAAYASIASLAELVFVGSTHPHDIEIYRRDASGALVRADGTSGLTLQSLGIAMTREDLLAGL